MLVVNEFTKRKLSRSGDRLNAIAGIAELFSNLLRVPYVGGLWDTNLLHQMLWTAVGDNKPRPFHYRAPSWSWASLDVPVWFYAGIDFAPFRCELLESHITLRNGSSAFGAASSGYIKLNGAMRKGWFQRPSAIIFDLIEGNAATTDTVAASGDGKDDRASESYSDDLDAGYLYPQATLDSWDEQDSDLGWVYCFVIGRTYSGKDRSREWGTSATTEGLILLPCSPDTMTFRRIGTFSQSGRDVGVGADWPLCKVTIV
jgi:hypothetical protein